MKRQQDYTNHMHASGENEREWEVGGVGKMSAKAKIRGGGGKAGDQSEEDKKCLASRKASRRNLPSQRTDLRRLSTPRNVVSRAITLLNHTTHLAARAPVPDSDQSPNSTLLLLSQHHER